MIVASYNIHDGIGRDGRFDPGRVARILKGFHADLIALQEVTLDHHGRLLIQLQAATGLIGVDGSLFERGVGRYGNVLLLRPDWLIESRVHDISQPGREPRGVIEAWIGNRQSPLRVLATHLGLMPAERRRQVAGLKRLISQRDEPTVLLGDLNHVSAWPGLRPLKAHGLTHQAVRSFPTRPFPLLALDRIFVTKQVTLKRCWALRTPFTALASDHFPLLADIDWPDSPDCQQDQ
ncbi:MAG: endonuclease/exonuclease/phosphatase family protein [Gammaproteobacteria bacterium]